LSIKENGKRVLHGLKQLRAQITRAAETCVISRYRRAIMLLCRPEWD
jgi:hypothetical protein